MWRHGDVMIAAVGTVPEGARKREQTILARGEVTGHAHRVAEAGAAQVWDFNGTLFLSVVADRATIVHEEHKPIELVRGTYRVWMQREYTPAEIRRVVD